MWSCRKITRTKNWKPKFEALMDKYILPQIQNLIPIKVNSYKEFKALGNVFEFTLAAIE